MRALGDRGWFLSVSGGRADRTALLHLRTTRLHDELRHIFDADARSKRRRLTTSAPFTKLNPATSRRCTTNGDAVTTNAYQDIEKLETDLWSAADNLRANSKLTSSDYFMPVLGIIFLRHAANRFETARAQIEADQAAGVMRKRPIQPADYVRRRALWLPEAARFDYIMAQAAP